MAVSFSRSWGDLVADVTESPDYQTCTIRVDWSKDVLDVYDRRANEAFQVDQQVSVAASYAVDTFHILQQVLSTPDATQAEMDQAEGEYNEAVMSLLTMIGILSPPNVIVSTSSIPVGHPGDVWIRKVDDIGAVMVFSDSWKPIPVSSTVYSGQARLIPVRAGVWQGGESQLNATTIRAIRFQVPRSARNVRFHAGAIVTILSAPFNGSLVGRTAKVDEDFLGSTTATRTFHATMDADSEDS